MIAAASAAPKIPKKNESSIYTNLCAFLRSDFESTNMTDPQKAASINDSLAFGKKTESAAMPKSVVDAIVLAGSVIVNPITE